MMTDTADLDDFDLADFLPYLMNQAADVLSLEFQKTYRGRYGMLRTEWRVLFHLGRYGAMTAKEICDRARMHKTKVSRAVSALETKRFVEREVRETDRRHAELRLTAQGERVFRTLSAEARAYDETVRARLTETEAEVLRKCLRRLADLPPGTTRATAKGT
jgi:DNA-binding MarR family transcriptional regulator